MSDPEAQVLQLCQACVEDLHIFRDMGVSGGPGNNARNGWCRPHEEILSVVHHCHAQAS